MRYAHLASRLFGVPLLIERTKLDVILSVIAPRLGGDDEPQLSLEMYGPGDTGKSRKSYYVTDDKIGVVSIVGPLVKRASGEFLSGGPTTYGEVEMEIMDAITDPEIKGVLLAVDSPGGESVGAFELSDLIFSQRSSKPIFAAADGDAFSAAYALASAADQLYVTKSGGVGSVGVWMAHVDQSGFNKQKGLKPTFLFAGARKLDGNPHEPLTDDARETFQAEIDRIYSMFVETVARNRAMSMKSVKQTEAGLYFGQSGVDIGFADQVGTLSDALAGLRAAIARPAKSSSVVASAASPIPTKEVSKMEPDVKADAPLTTAEPKAPDVTVAVSVVDAQSILDQAAEIAELCGLAGQPKMAAAFIRAGKPLADVRAELLKARADQDAATEIHSQVPLGSNADTGRGAPTANPNDSPVVQAAERLAAQAAKGGK
jgi:signal peptide peptidase SppA